MVPTRTPRYGIKRPETSKIAASGPSEGDPHEEHHHEHCCPLESQLRAAIVRTETADLERGGQAARARSCAAVGLGQALERPIGSVVWRRAGRKT